MNTCPIVAVASSARDLEAVSELLSGLPAQCGSAIIVVQHFDAGREALLVGSLARRTILPVLLAHDGMLAERDHVYVIPGNAALTVAGRRLRVTRSASAAHYPGDILLTLLAEECSNGAIGVVLSGGGCDGALGIRAIRQRGGATFAQYPGSSRFPSMPINAIETGCVDFVLRPNEIARGLIALGRRAAIPADTARRAPVINDNVDPGRRCPQVMPNALALIANRGVG